MHAQPSQPKILISILVYNKVEDALATVKCFRKQTYSNYQLVVVDNASSFSSFKKLQEGLPHDVQLVRLEENLGFAGGNNVALKMAAEHACDYVIISNDDIIFGDNLLANLVETAESQAACGIVGAIEEDYYTGKVRAVGGRGFSFLKSRGQWLQNLPLQQEDSAEYDYVQGALMMLSKKALQGGIKLDEKLFMYCEEVDLGFQLNKIGLKSVVDLRTRVRHKSVSRSFVPYQGYYIQRNRLYLSKKHAPLHLYLLSVLCMGIVELPIKVFLRTLQGNFSYARVCMSGFADAVKGVMGKKHFKEKTY